VPQGQFRNLMGWITASKGKKCYERSERGETPSTFCACDEATYDSGFPTLLINFGGQQFNFEPKHYVIYDTYKKVCLITFQEETRPVYFWLLGDPFLRAFFQIYDV
jgi:hypothetical protein